MKKQKLLCTKVETRAFDNQHIELSGDDADVTLRLKNQKDFGSFQEGKEYPLSFASEIAKTVLGKKKSK